jgi:hypothetical protein
MPGPLGIDIFAVRDGQVREGLRHQINGLF